MTISRFDRKAENKRIEAARAAAREPFQILDVNGNPVPLIAGAKEEEKVPVLRGEVVQSIAGSDDDLTLAFTSTMRNELRYVGEWGKWFRFTGRWEEIKTPSVWNLIRPLARQYAYMTEKNPSKIVSKSTIANVEALARGADGIMTSAAIWDANLLVLNTPAGLVDLTTGELHDADPLAYCIKTTAVAPRAGAFCPLWREFLDDITNGNVELQSFLQRMVGYSLTGATSEHAMFFFYGTGGNGKGVFISTITGILASYGKTAPVDTFTETKSDRHPTDIAGLRGARFVAAEETNEGRAWDEAKVKALTGGGTISARFMHQDFFEFVPQFKLIIAGNHKPRLRNIDEAIRRRLHVVPFDVIIPKEKRDPDLSEKLKAEWPGILRWAIEGCLAWQLNGLAPPAAVLDATGNYFGEQDPLTAWMEECCIRKPDGWTSNADLYSSYVAYMGLNSEPVEGSKRFSQRLESAGFRRLKHGAQGDRGFAGLSLLPAVVANDIPDIQKGEF